MPGNPLMTDLVTILEDAARRGDYQGLAEKMWIPIGRNPGNGHFPTLSFPLPLYPPSSPLKDVIQEYLYSLDSLSQGNLLKTFEHLSNSLQSLLKALIAEDNRQLLLLKRLARNLCHCALEADKREHREGHQLDDGDVNGIQQSRLREDAARLLSRVFTVTITDRAPLTISKKWASLLLANLLFRLYFSLGTVRLCVNIVRAIDTTAQTDFPPPNQFPKAEAVTYGYFRARLALNQNDLKLAQKHLVETLALCPASFPKHQR